MYLLVGGSGAPNYGDELILKAWLDSLLGNGLDVRVESNIKSNSAKFHGKREGVAYQGFLKRIAKNKTQIGFWHQVKRGAEFFENNGPSIYGKNKFSFLDDLDVIHLHGGGYINSNAEANGFLLGFCYAACEKTGARLVGTGLGLQPIKHPPQDLKKLAGDVFRSFYGIELRDKESFDFVIDVSEGEANAVFGFDDVYLFDSSSFQSRGEERLILSFSKHNIQKFEDKYWEDLSLFRERFGEVAFWECYPWQDKDVYSFLQEKLPGIRKIDVKESVYGEEGFSEKDTLVTTRFHPHLIASRLGAKGYYYSDSKYYDVKHGSVVACGSPFKRGLFSGVDNDLVSRRSLVGELDKGNVDKKRMIVNCFLEGVVSI